MDSIRNGWAEQGGVQYDNNVGFVDARMNLDLLVADPCERRNWGACTFRSESRKTLNVLLLV